jgi:ribonuclease HI
MGPKQQKSSYYAVRCGRNIGVYKTWSECQSNVKGFPGAVFKKFDTVEEAEQFSKKPSASYKDDLEEDGNIEEPTSNKQSIYDSRNTSNDICISSVFGVTEDKEVPTRKSRDTSKDVSITSIWLSDESKTTEKRKYHADGSDDIYKQRYKLARVDPSFSSSTEHKQKKVSVVYTDGASSNNGKSYARAGYGVYWGDNDPRNASVRLVGEKQTNQRAEASAVIHALEQSQNGTDTLEIMTDSQYVIKAATIWSKNWIKKKWISTNGSEVQNRDLFERMLKLIDTRKGEVKFTYVPGHQGVEGNEKADQLAVAGAQKNL